MTNPTTARHLPVGLLAELSHRCPLRCPYCSNPVNLERRHQELDTIIWQRVFREAAELGVLQVHLSGGEPTVRPDLEDLVRTAFDLGLYTNLITSGVLLDRVRMHALAEAGLDHVQISLQAASQAEGDRIGGFAGGHVRKLELAQHVRAAGMALTINAVMHRQNLDELPALIDLAVALGADRLEVAHTQYYGWAAVNRAALMPTPEQVAAAAQTVRAATARLKGQMAIDYVAPDYYAVRPKACMGGWARQFLVVTPAGQVLPCHAAQTIKTLEFENVRDRSLADIWHHSEAFNRYRGTDWMPEPCRSCRFQTEDWGGCRCQAFALTGEAARTDPACSLSPDRHLLRVHTSAQARQDAFVYRQFGTEITRDA